MSANVFVYKCPKCGRKAYELDTLYEIYCVGSLDDPYDPHRKEKMVYLGRIEEVEQWKR